MDTKVTLEWVLQRKALPIGGWLSCSEDKAKLALCLLTALICRALVCAALGK